MTQRIVTFILSASVLASTGLLAGNVTGKIEFKGKAPAEVRLNMNADPVCKREHPGPVYSQDVVVNKNGTLKNVIVYIKSGLPSKTYPTPDTKVTLDQKGCEYYPHVVGVMVGQDMDIKNSDPTLHNVHSLSKLNPEFNRAQPMKGMVMSEKFAKPEVFKVKCEVHPWMGAYIGVFSTPYFAVTGDDGTFTLTNVPPGEYTVEAWQEKYGVQTATVKVGPSGNATVDFTYKGE